MRLQEHMIGVIEGAREEVFRYARAVPREKWEWRPMDEGQSVLSIAREMAKTPDWAYQVLTGAEPEWDEDAGDSGAAQRREAQRREMESWKTIDECEAACREKLVRLHELYRSLTDEDLRRTKWLPYNGGRDHTYEELLDYPRWNFTYHLGQIAYIQTLYGDREMY